jgi:hypothetical protein
MKMAEIILAKSNGVMVKVLVDAEDFAEMSKLRWYVNAARRGSVYTIIRPVPKIFYTVYMARMLMNAQSGEYIDHINGNPCDNQKENLRKTTNQENCQNRHGTFSNNTSGYRGVSYQKGYKKWEAYYWKDYKKIKVGYFDNIEDAAAAVSLARRANLPFSEADKVGAILDVNRAQRANMDSFEMDQIAA